MLHLFFLLAFLALYNTGEDGLVGWLPLLLDAC